MKENRGDTKPLQYAATCNSSLYAILWSMDAQLQIEEFNVSLRESKKFHKVEHETNLRNMSM